MEDGLIVAVGVVVALVYLSFVAAGILWRRDFHGKWHDAYRCDGCGHTEDNRPRFYWPRCGGCGSTDTGTKLVIRRWRLFGWEER